MKFQFDLRPRIVATKLLICYLVICAGMYGAQRRIMYLPLNNTKPPVEYGLSGYRELTLTTADNTNIAAWQHYPAKGFPTIVYFHGNGGHMGHRAYRFSLLTNAGFGLLAIDYRGYGKSEGSPSETGLYEDGRAAMNYALKTLGLPPERLILYGESLGTAVTIQMATEYKVGAVVLQSPFASMTAIGKHRYPWLPVTLLLKDPFDSISKIEHVNAPVLFYHGELDRVVPVAQGRELFAKANEPKEAIYYPERGHMNISTRELTESLIAFCTKYKLIR